MSSTPVKPPVVSSSKHGSTQKHGSSGKPHHSSSSSSKNGTTTMPKVASSTPSKVAKKENEMDADELVDHILADDNSSISSMDVSEDEQEKTDINPKKRARPESDNEDASRLGDEESILYVSLNSCSWPI